MPMIRDIARLVFTLGVVMITFPAYVLGWVIGAYLRAFFAGRSAAERW